MRDGGGKQKGSEFERVICKRLSLWVSHGRREDLYWRSAMSGGRATIQNRKGVKNVTQLGDITSVDSSGEWLTNKFIVECKAYKDLSVDSFLLKRKGTLYNFWIKLLRDCHSVDRGHSPLLIVKQDRWPILVLTTTSGSNLLGFDSGEALVFVPKMSCEVYEITAFDSHPFGGIYP